MHTLLSRLLSQIGMLGSGGNPTSLARVLPKMRMFLRTRPLILCPGRLVEVQKDFPVGSKLENYERNNAQVNVIDAPYMLDVLPSSIMNSFALVYIGLDPTSFSACSRQIPLPATAITCLGFCLYESMNHDPWKRSPDGIHWLNKMANILDLNKMK